jgi:general secretion pathway protein I
VKIQSGFTLIEALVALAIVAIALGAAVKAASTLTQSTQRQGDAVLAQLCAENELVRMRLQGIYPAVGDSRFDCAQGGKSFVGEMVVRPTPNPNFRRADAIVRLQAEQGGWQLYKLSTILGRY